jgi:hyperosmotically inducible periplasmic protein
MSNRHRIVVVLAALMALPSAALAYSYPVIAPQNAAAPSGDDARIQDAVRAKLKDKKFKDIQVTVQGGNVTLTGSVNLFDTAMDAYNKTRKVAGVTGVTNQLVVNTASVPDAELQSKLLKKIAYDRAAWPDQPFNAITVNVQNGVVTLGGSADAPYAAQSAVQIASQMPGVKMVQQRIVIDPTAPFDRTIRGNVYRLIYRNPALTQYAGDPVKPIRIVVQNGHVTLVGDVNTKMDYDIAAQAAKNAPNTFSVVNNLTIKGQYQTPPPPGPVFSGPVPTGSH